MSQKEDEALKRALKVAQEHKFVRKEEPHKKRYASRAHPYIA
jgi:hypothetical protein